jgi:hypothetical protein
MGCAADNDPSCMRSWLQDPDGDGVFSLSTTQVPAGSYHASAAGSAQVAFTVPDAGYVTTFSYDSSTHALTVAMSQPGSKPDLSTAAAYWLDARTIAYPRNRLPGDVDPVWLRYRLHWGSLAVDATSLGGMSAAVSLVPGGPDGYLALRLDRRTADRLQQVKAGPMVAIGVYDDAQRLIDATGVHT